MNDSKKKDARFWRKWRLSGAVTSGNKHFDECMLAALKYELKGKPIEAGCMRVVAYNDYSNFKTVPKPPLGRAPVLHQAYEGMNKCLYCSLPMDEWKLSEDCSAQRSEKRA